MGWGRQTPAAVTQSYGFTLLIRYVVLNGSLLLWVVVLSRIIDIIQGSDVICLPVQSRGLTEEPIGEYETEQKPVETPFENPRLNAGKKDIRPEPPVDRPSLFRFFMDGTRRTYRFADVVKDNRYYPLVAGQVAVGVLERTRERLQPLRDTISFENVLAFPDTFPDGDIDAIRAAIADNADRSFEIEKYKVDRQGDPLDRALAVIMARMHQQEIDTVARLADSRRLSHDRMLIMDGALKFQRKLDTAHFRNVIGISKTFRPDFSLGKGRKKQDVGKFVQMLNFGERTTVFKSFIGERILGTWYLRIRNRRHMDGPLDGIVKVDTFAVGEEERELGLNAERVDTISRHILAERNVSPFGADRRWATHLYPIYLTESYLKSNFLSDISFEALF